MSRSVRPLALPVAAVALAAVVLPASAATPVWAPSLPPTYAGLTSLSLFPGGVGYAARPDTDPQGSTLWRTDDAGATWARVGDLPGQFASETRFLDPRAGLSVDGVLRRTTDGGRTWSAVPVLPPEEGRLVQLQDVAVAGGAVAVSGGSYRGPLTCGGDQGLTTGVVATSTDRGATWRQRETGPSRGVYDVAVRPDGSGALLSERDERRTEPWTVEAGGQRVDVGCTSYVSDRSEAAVEVFDDSEDGLRTVLSCGTVGCSSLAVPAPGVLVVGRPDGSVSRSDDGGATWTTVPLVTGGAQAPDTAALRVDAFSFPDAATGYAATRAGGVFATRDGGRTWQEELSPQEVPGTGAGDVAAAGGTALLQGPTGVSRRLVVG